MPMQPQLPNSEFQQELDKGEATPAPAPAAAPTMSPRVSDPEIDGMPSPDDGAAPGSDEGALEAGIPQEEIENYFNSLPEPAMAYLAEHMTPEIINVIRIVSGKEVGDYLNQFADQDKVLVPVPRQMAEEYRQQAMSQSQPQQGPAPTPQPQAQPAPRPQGMMAPAV